MCVYIYIHMYMYMCYMFVLPFCFHPVLSLLEEGPQTSKNRRTMKTIESPRKKKVYETNSGGPWFTVFAAFV